jgi:hypothetical protein
MNIALTPGKHDLAHDLASAIAEADIRVLLMVLVHMSGDLRWLEPPYAPRRDVRLIPDWPACRKASRTKSAPRR